LRQHEPVHRTTAGFYLLSRHADALWLLRNTGTVFLGPKRAQLSTHYPRALSHESQAMIIDTLPTEDGSDHSRLRRLISHEFTRKSVDNLRSDIAGNCTRLLDAIAEPLYDGEIIDLHHTVALPLALTMTCEIFGVSEVDRSWLAAAAADLDLAAGSLSEEVLAVADERARQVQAYLQDLIAERRHAPREDLASVLVAAHDEDEHRVDDDELAGLLRQALVFNNLAVSIDLGVLAMSNSPDQRAWLCGDHGQVVAFVDEVLRHNAPELYSCAPRIATRDVEFCGVTIPAGSDVRAMLAAANRDPEVFADPDRFDPPRDTREMLTFGQGIHYCLGVHLARAEMAIALSHLQARFPTLMAGEPLWRGGFKTRLPQRVPVFLRTP